MRRAEVVGEPDAFHLAVSDRVSDLDREFKLAYPDAGYVIRPATPHELCPPGGPCRVIAWVKVTFIAEGMRTREAWRWTH